MQPKFINCPSCHGRIPLNFYNSATFEICPGCSKEIRTDVFPALVRVQEKTQVEHIVSEGEAPCYYHASKKAVVPCDACGRFLCGLCDMELNGEHLCPACLEAGRQRGKLKQLDRRRTLYDQIAIAWAVVGLLLCAGPSLVCAPVALYISLRYRNRPGSIVRPSKMQFTIATILASLQIIGWICFFAYLATTST